MSAANNTGAIIEENLSILSDDSCNVSEKRLLQLKERALAILRSDDVLFSDDRTEEFPALFPEANISKDVPEEAHSYIKAQAKEQTLLDKLTVCKLVAEAYSKRPPLLERLLKCEKYSPSAKIAYFRNVYADAAFRAFSEHLGTPTVTYTSDFNSVCEEVYYGRSDMCLLPLDNSRDSKLVSFYKLIEKYELFPIYSCDVATPDGSITTRYALLRRAPALPERDQRDADHGCLLEFTLSPDEDVTLADVLYAAELCKLSLYKLDSLPSTYTDGAFTYDIVLSISGADALDAFILFLSLFVPQYEMLGVYRHIRTEI